MKFKNLTLLLLIINSLAGCGEDVAVNMVEKAAYDKLEKEYGEVKNELNQKINKLEEENKKLIEKIDGDAKKLNKIF